MIIKRNQLRFIERRELLQLARSKSGLTVGEAREFVSPKGGSLVLQTTVFTAVLMGIGLLFTPFMLLAVFTPIAFPLVVVANRKRWLVLLPTDRDNEPLEVE